MGDERDDSTEGEPPKRDSDRPQGEGFEFRDSAPSTDAMDAEGLVEEVADEGGEGEQGRAQSAQDAAAGSSSGPERSIPPPLPPKQQTFTKRMWLMGAAVIVAAVVAGLVLGEVFVSKRRAAEGQGASGASSAEESSRAGQQGSGPQADDPSASEAASGKQEDEEVRLNPVVIDSKKKGSNGSDGK
jgi:hypothetical protein